MPLASFSALGFPGYADLFAYLECVQLEAGGQLVGGAVCQSHGQRFGVDRLDRAGGVSRRCESSAAKAQASIQYKGKDVRTDILSPQIGWPVVMSPGPVPDCTRYSGIVVSATSAVARLILTLQSKV